MKAGKEQVSYKVYINVEVRKAKDGCCEEIAKLNAVFNCFPVMIGKIFSRCWTRSPKRLGMNYLCNCLFGKHILFRKFYEFFRFQEANLITTFY